MGTTSKLFGLIYLRTFEGNLPSKLTKPDDLLALVGTS